MLKSHFSSAQQGLPPCPALCSGYCSYFQGLKKISVLPHSPSLPGISFCRLSQAPHSAPPFPSTIAALQGLPRPGVPWLGAVPAGPPQAQPDRWALPSCSDSLKQTENKRTNTVEASASQWSQLYLCPVSCFRLQGPGRRQQQGLEVLRGQENWLMSNLDT